MDTNPVSQYFQNTKQFEWIVKTDSELDFADGDLINFFNPVRPAFVQVIDANEHEYISKLSSEDQLELLENLAQNFVNFLVFTNETPLLECFTQQAKINVLKTTLSPESLIHDFGDRFSSEFLSSEIVQGGLLIVENQGMLITGKSGAGKSQLLLSLLNRGHQWVSEELTHCYLDHNHRLIGKAVGELASYAHVKHIGPINIDQTYGLSKRLIHYPLAGVIHLGENSVSETRQLPTYEQKLQKNILGRKLPVWYLSEDCRNPELLIEACAKQIILSQWGSSAETEMEKEHKALINDPA